MTEEVQRSAPFELGMVSNETNNNLSEYRSKKNNGKSNHFHASSPAAQLQDEHGTERQIPMKNRRSPFYVRAVQTGKMTSF